MASRSATAWPAAGAAWRCRSRRSSPRSARSAPACRGGGLGRRRRAAMATGAIEYASRAMVEAQVTDADINAAIARTMPVGDDRLDADFRLRRMPPASQRTAMDRIIVYPGSIPLDTDLLNTNRNVMLALHGLIAATLGTATAVDGLQVAPTIARVDERARQRPAADAVRAGGQHRLRLAAADTLDQIVKMAVQVQPVTMSVTAPLTPGTTDRLSAGGGVQRGRYRRGGAALLQRRQSRRSPISGRATTARRRTRCASRAWCCSSRPGAAATTGHAGDAAGRSGLGGAGGDRGQLWRDRDRRVADLPCLDHAVRQLQAARAAAGIRAAASASPAAAASSCRSG